MKKKILSLIISSILVIGGGTTVFIKNSKVKAPTNVSKETETTKDSSEDIDIASSDSQIATQESNEQTNTNESASEVNTVKNNISSENSRANESNTNVSNSNSLDNNEKTKPNQNKKPTTNNGQVSNANTSSNGNNSTNGNTTGNNTTVSNNKPQSKPSTSSNGMPSIPQKYNVEFLSQVELEILTLCNNERAKAGLKPLSMDENMRKAARYKAEEMLQYGYFDHNSPYTGSPFQLLKKFNVSYTTAGENIQSSTGAGKASVTAQSIVSRWMNSPGHRANILNGSFGRMGIGVAFSSNGNLAYESQLFAN